MGVALAEGAGVAEGFGVAASVRGNDSCAIAHNAGQSVMQKNSCQIRFILLFDIFRGDSPQRATCRGVDRSRLTIG